MNTEGELRSWYGQAIPQGVTVAGSANSSKEVKDVKNIRKATEKMIEMRETGEGSTAQQQVTRRTVSPPLCQGALRGVVAGVYVDVGCAPQQDI